MKTKKNKKTSVKNENFVTQTKFAGLIKSSRQYVFKLKNAGRLVMTRDGKFIKVKESLELIGETADPANDPTNTMAAESDAEHPQNKSENGATTKFHRSRAEKETFNAKLAELEYLERIGQLVNIDGVSRATFKIGKVLQNKLSSIPARLAPIVTVELDQKTNFQTIQKAIEKAVQETLDMLAVELANYRKGTVTAPGQE